MTWITAGCAHPPLSLWHVYSYQDGTGNTTCKLCPSKSYAHLPGAAACMKCVNGRASACPSANCNADAPSPGYAYARWASGFDKTCNYAAGDVSALFSTYAPVLYQTCRTDFLSFLVKANCEVVVSPLFDDYLTASGLSCAAPTNADAWITAYYTSTSTITSKLSNS